MVEAAQSLQGLIEKQMIWSGDMLAVLYFKFQVYSARRHSWSKERPQDYVQKFRNYCPTPSDFSPKPKNAGRQPGYSTRERHEDSALIFNRIEEDEEIHPAGNSNICLK